MNLDIRTRWDELTKHQRSHLSTIGSKIKAPERCYTTRWLHLGHLFGDCLLNFPMLFVIGTLIYVNWTGQGTLLKYLSRYWLLFYLAGIPRYWYTRIEDVSDSAYTTSYLKTVVFTGALIFIMLTPIMSFVAQLVDIFILFMALLPYVVTAAICLFVVPLFIETIIVGWWTHAKHFVINKNMKKEEF